MEMKNNLIITNTFRKQVIENKAKLADNMKVLLYEENNKIFDKLDFNNDNIFLEPLLFKDTSKNPFLEVPFSKTLNFRENLNSLKIKAGLLSVQILLLLSCSTESAYRDKVYDSQINYIKINPKKTVQWNLSQVADSAFIIKLEKNEESIIGVIKDILIHSDKIYVLDATHARDVFVFDMNGKFIFKLDKAGKGPHEYYNPDALNINEYTNQLEVYDAQNRTILKYTLDGEFISKVKSVPSIREFVNLDSAIRACLKILYSIIV